jgi:hypothetical protein
LRREVAHATIVRWLTFTIEDSTMTADDAWDRQDMEEKAAAT